LAYLGVSYRIDFFMPRVDDLPKQRSKSISNTVVNFLTALSVIYGGASEILPFVRYLSQFIDFEFDTIKAQNHGKGVICAATW
jgi:hypothetical protein